MNYKITKKKKATKKELEELRKLFEDIQNDPEAMRQIRRIARGLQP